MERRYYTPVQKNWVPIERRRNGPGEGGSRVVFGGDSALRYGSLEVGLISWWRFRPAFEFMSGGYIRCLYKVNKLRDDYFSSPFLFGV